NASALDYEITYLKKLPEIDIMDTENITENDIMNFDVNQSNQYEKNELEEFFVSELGNKIDVPKQLDKECAVENDIAYFNEDSVETDDFMSIFKAAAAPSDKTNQIQEDSHMIDENKQEELKEKIKSKFIFISDDELDDEKDSRFTGKLEFGTDFSIKRKDKNNSKLF
ncbi:MAG: hypothetical protein RSB96_01535, partial [Oscillospiraceae bacterium]